jgi:hypothetical protein
MVFDKTYKCFHCINIIINIRIRILIKENGVDQNEQPLSRSDHVSKWNFISIAPSNGV